jgi:hypothetical protein
MRNLAFSVALLAASTLAGAQDAAALKGFESLVRECKASFDSQALDDVIYNERVKAWVHRVFGKADVTYDVRRSDSLVSPYTAKIVIRQQSKADRAESEESAKALHPQLDKGSDTTETLEYGFVKGAWRLVSTETSSSFAGLPPHTAKFAANPADPPRKGPIAACIKF